MTGCRKQLPEVEESRKEKVREMGKPFLEQELSTVPPLPWDGGHPMCAAHPSMDPFMDPWSHPQIHPSIDPSIDPFMDPSIDS